MALAADADFFLTVAKFRALRRLWGRVLEVAGATDAMPGLHLHAETATRMLSRRAPYVNVLRGTVAAFAAAAGGATSITVLPFDHALGPPEPLARRIARNTQLVLLEESNLGRVADPAGGSWYVESLTEQLALKAWGWCRKRTCGGWCGLLEVRRDASSLPDVLAGAAGRFIAAPASQSPAVSESRRTCRPPAMSPPSHVGNPPAFSRTAARWAGGDRAAARPQRRNPDPQPASGRACSYAISVGWRNHSPGGLRHNLFEAGGFATIMSEPMASPDNVANGFRPAEQVSPPSARPPTTRPWRNRPQPPSSTRECRHLPDGPARRSASPAWQAAGVDEFVHAAATFWRHSSGPTLVSAVRQHDRIPSFADLDLGPPAADTRHGPMGTSLRRRDRSYAGATGLADAGGDPGQAALHRPPTWTGLDFLDTYPGIAPVPARAVPDHVRQPALDDPPVRRLLHRRGVQRVLPAQPRRRAEGAVGRLRPGHPPRLRQRPPAGRPATSAWPAWRSTPSSTCASCSTASRWTR